MLKIIDLKLIETLLIADYYLSPVNPSLWQRSYASRQGSL